MLNLLGSFVLAALDVRCPVARLLLAWVARLFFSSEVMRGDAAERTGAGATASVGYFPSASRGQAGGWDVFRNTGKAYRQCLLPRMGAGSSIQGLISVARAVQQRNALVSNCAWWLCSDFENSRTLQ